MKQLFLIFAFTALNVFATSEAGHQLSKIQQAWERLGSRTVDMRADHDVIDVTVTDGVFTALKLKIMKAPLHLNNINVIFGNGDNENFVFDKNFPAGTETRILDLPGNGRFIKSVRLNYKSIPTQKGRAVVTLWGRH